MSSTAPNDRAPHIRVIIEDGDVYPFDDFMASWDEWYDGFHTRRAAEIHPDRTSKLIIAQDNRIKELEDQNVQLRRALVSANAWHDLFNELRRDVVDDKTQVCEES